MNGATFPVEVMVTGDNWSSRLATLASVGTAEEALALVESAGYRVMRKGQRGSVQLLLNSDERATAWSVLVHPPDGS